MAEKKIPLRKCTGCGNFFQKKELIRVIRTPEDEIVLDPTGKKNGRGAYICKSESCLLLAKKNRGIERSLKTTISPDVYDALLKELNSYE